MRNELSELIRESMKEVREINVKLLRLEQLKKDLAFLKRDHEEVHERVIMKARLEIEETEYKLYETYMITDALIKSKTFIDDIVEVFYL